MSSDYQKAEPKPEFTVRRKLKFECDNEQQCHRALEHLRSMSAVVSAECEADRLCLKYDAALVQLDQLLDLIEPAGLTLRNGWLDRVRLGFYRMTDRNTYDAARHVPHCCSKSPK